MGFGIVILLVTIVFGGITTFGVLFIIKILKKQVTESSGTDRNSANDKIAKLDKVIEQSIAKFPDMVSLDEIIAVEKDVKKSEENLVKEREKLEKLEGKLATDQSQVDIQEAKHNEMKQGKEECLKVAGSVRENADRLLSEFNQLESQLKASKEQMTSLANNPELSEEQQAALDEVSRSLANQTEQFTNLNEAYEQAKNRFLSLQTQYDELENEYRKLVDKELSGTF
jgi:DNA repair exonuclease SbcCD ATPase subunit